MAQIPDNYTVIDNNDDDTLYVNTPDSVRAAVEQAAERFELWYDDRDLMDVDFYRTAILDGFAEFLIETHDRRGLHHGEWDEFLASNCTTAALGEFAADYVAQNFPPDEYTDGDKDEAVDPTGDAMTITQSEAMALAHHPHTTCVASEVGRVSGSAYREEYRLEDGRYLQVTWDQACGDLPTAWDIRAKRSMAWVIAR